jgi:capsular exopolysaccharide synthesis family protein
MNNNGFNSYSSKELRSIDERVLKSKNKSHFSLEQYLLKLKRRWKPAILVFLATLGSAIALSFFLEESYQAKGKLLFKQNTAASLRVGEENSQSSNLLTNQTPLNNEIEKITTSPVLQKTIDRLGLTDESGNPLKPETLAQNLDIELVGDSDVIEVAYDSEEPELAANVVNTLMDIYLQEQIISNRAEPANAKEFINRQLPEIEAQVETAESELEEFRTTNNIIDLQAEKKIIVQELGTLNREIASIGASYEGKQAQAQAIGDRIGLNLEQAIAANELGNTPIVQSTLSELANTEIELAQERQRFNDNHPSVASLLDKKANLRQQLKQSIAENIGEGVEVSDGILNSGQTEKETLLDNYINLKIEELNLQRQLSSVSRSQQNYLERAKSLPQLEKTEQELVRKAEAVNNTYTALLDSLQQVELAQNQQTQNIEIIETANTPEDSSSQRIPLIALGLVSGLFLANATVFTLEWRDRTIKSVAELKKKLPFKVLGILPQLDDYPEQGVTVRDEPDSYVSELYRMLQANLKFMNTESSPQVIMITSSVSGEGKSTIAANLATAIAQLDRHVLLLDGDLRKPTQKNLWQIEAAGLQEAIREQKPLASAVVRPMAKLDLLISSDKLSNPLALLDSPEMSQLIAQGRKTYDLILIDAPPLPVSADVLTLSKMVDGILFVSRLGVVEQESAELALEILTSIDSNILGMVINGVKGKEFDRYSYSSKYGKQYFKGQSTISHNSSNNLDNSSKLARSESEPTGDRPASINTNQ